MENPIKIKRRAGGCFTEVHNNVIKVCRKSYPNQWEILYQSGRYPTKIYIKSHSKYEKALQINVGNNADMHRKCYGNQEEVVQKPMGNPTESMFSSKSSASLPTSKGNPTEINWTPYQTP